LISQCNFKFLTDGVSKMNELKLSTNLVNAILQYLATKPYQEVYQIVEAIQKEASPQAQPGDVTDAAPAA
jgi:hypothetical protein